MTTSARARVGKKLFRTAVVIAEPTVHGTSSSVKRFVDMHPNARGTDRKSTRLNSSHGYISYAVFCLKKKKSNHEHALTRDDSTLAVNSIPGRQIAQAATPSPWLTITVTHRYTQDQTGKHVPLYRVVS